MLTEVMQPLHFALQFKIKDNKRRKQSGEMVALELYVTCSKFSDLDCKKR
jgi:hypothetical protein